MARAVGWRRWKGGEPWWFIGPSQQHSAGRMVDDEPCRMPDAAWAKPRVVAIASEDQHAGACTSIDDLSFWSAPSCLSTCRPAETGLCGVEESLLGRLEIVGQRSSVGCKATAQQVCPSPRQGVQTFGVNDMEQLDARGGLVADGIDACLPRAFSEPDHDLHLRALLTTWLRLADQAIVPLRPRARRRAPSPHPAAGTPGSLADGRGSAKPAAKAAWPVSQRMSGWGRR